MEVAIILFGTCLAILAINHYRVAKEYKSRLGKEKCRRLNRAISELYEFSERFQNMSMRAALYSKDKDFSPEAREYYRSASGAWQDAAIEIKHRLKRLQKERDGRKT